MESFIDLGEGIIREVLQLAEEKHWLRSYTKISDMLQQALAASRFASRVEAGEAYGSEDELSEDEMEDILDDLDALPEEMLDTIMDRLELTDLYARASEASWAR